MKIQGAKKVHYDSGPNMTPLVDVVMVILIFLMLAGSFGATEKYLISDVPVMEKGGGGKSSDSIVPNKFTILVAQRGTFYTAKAGNFATVDSSKDPTKAYDDLYRQLVGQYQQFERAGIKPDDVQVLIFPKKEVTLDNLITVYQAALEANFKKVGFGIAN